jgi:hypothetical protein
MTKVSKCLNTFLKISRKADIFTWEKFFNEIYTPIIHTMPRTIFAQSRSTPCRGAKCTQNSPFKAITDLTCPFSPQFTKFSTEVMPFLCTTEFKMATTEWCTLLSAVKFQDPEGTKLVTQIMLPIPWFSCFFWKEKFRKYGTHWEEDPSLKLQWKTDYAVL